MDLNVFENEIFLAILYVNHNIIVWWKFSRFFKVFYSKYSKIISK